MQFSTVNPAEGTTLRTFPFMSSEAVDAAVSRAARAQRSWARRQVDERAERVTALGVQFRERQRRLAEIMTMEMGKPLREAAAEVEKCALGCEHYGRHGPGFLRDRMVDTEAHRSFVTFQPLGLVLAIMPWNFPLWQVVRAAIPALIAGNGILLKHAPSVPCCALELVDLFEAAGFPKGIFTNLFVDVGTTGDLIRDARVQAVTLTGSTRAGRSVAEIAGSQIKTSVLELGGSDPYVVLEDADLPQTVDACVTGRLINGGQSCVAAKRFVVHEAVADEFTEAVVWRMGQVRGGRSHGRGDRRGAACARGFARPSGGSGGAQHRARGPHVYWAGRCRRRPGGTIRRRC